MEDSPRNGEARASRHWLMGGAWALGGRALSGLLGLAFFALLSRVLTPADFGAYSLILSVVTLGAVLGTFGLHQAAVRFVAESSGLGRHARVRGVIVKILLAGLVGAAAVGLVYLAAAPALSRFFSGAVAFTALAGWIVGWIVVVVAQRLMGETFRGFGDIRLATVFSGQRALGGLVAGSLAVAGLAALRLGGGAPLSTVVALSALAGLGGALLALPLLIGKVARLPADAGEGPVAEISFPEIAAMAWPVLIANLMMFVFNRGDLWIVGALLSKEEVALYAAGARLVGFVALPLGIVNAVVPPLIAELNVQGRRRELERVLRAAATAAGLPAFLALVALIAFGSPALGLVFGPFYRGGALVLALLAVGQLFNVWAGSCGVALIMTGHQRENMRVTVVTALAAIALGVPATRGFGIAGMAAVIAAATVARNLLLVLYARRRIGVWTQVSFSPAALRSLVRRARELLGARG